MQTNIIHYPFFSIPPYTAKINAFFKPLDFPVSNMFTLYLKHLKSLPLFNNRVLLINIFFQKKKKEEVTTCVKKAKRGVILCFNLLKD